MKQTAVEWLQAKLWENNMLTSEDLKLFEKAKEMEKEQIIYAHVAGHNAPSSTIKNCDAEQYYNQTFKQQEQ
jgi:hypothetical protein